MVFTFNKRRIEAHIHKKNINKVYVHNTILVMIFCVYFELIIFLPLIPHAHTTYLLILFVYNFVYFISDHFIFFPLQSPLFVTSPQSMLSIISFFYTIRTSTIFAIISIVFASTTAVVDYTILHHHHLFHHCCHHLYRFLFCHRRHYSWFLYLSHCVFWINSFSGHIISV